MNDFLIWLVVIVFMGGCLLIIAYTHEKTPKSNESDGVKFEEWKIELYNKTYGHEILGMLSGSDFDRLKDCISECLESEFSYGSMVLIHRDYISDLIYSLCDVSESRISERYREMKPQYREKFEEAIGEVYLNVKIIKADIDKLEKELSDKEQSEMNIVIDKQIKLMKEIRKDLSNFSEVIR